MEIISKKPYTIIFKKKKSDREWLHQRDNPVTYSGRAPRSSIFLTGRKSLLGKV